MTSIFLWRNGRPRQKCSQLVQEMKDRKEDSSFVIGIAKGTQGTGRGLLDRPSFRLSFRVPGFVSGVWPYQFVRKTCEYGPLPAAFQVMKSELFAPKRPLPGSHSRIGRLRRRVWLSIIRSPTSAAYRCLEFVIKSLWEVNTFKERDRLDPYLNAPQRSDWAANRSPKANLNNCSGSIEQ